MDPRQVLAHLPALQPPRAYRLCPPLFIEFRKHAPGAALPAISTAHVLFLLATQPEDLSGTGIALVLDQERWKDQARVAEERGLTKRCSGLRQERGASSGTVVSGAAALIADT
jgi:hypothetical protein